ncbi:MAG: hypothetical protein RL757_2705 [Bacteroidota bacterium]
MKILITYAPENQYIGSKIVAALSHRTVAQGVAIAAPNSVKSILAMATGFDKVIVVLTDNFLKNEYCMADALTMIQELQKNRQLVPLVADGVQEIEGKVLAIPTAFDRVSSVIQYMNFWQDRYLEIRRRKTDNDDIAFAERVRLVRGISSEVGELLRFFRSVEFLTFENVQTQGYSPLFQAVGLEAKPVQVAVEVEKPVVAPVVATVKEEKVLETILEQPAVVHTEIGNGKVADVADWVIPNASQNGFTNHHVSENLEQVVKEDIIKQIEKTNERELNTPSLLENIVDALPTPPPPVSNAQNGVSNIVADVLDLEDAPKAAIQPPVQEVQDLKAVFDNSHVAPKAAEIVVETEAEIVESPEVSETETEAIKLQARQLLEAAEQPSEAFEFEEKVEEKMEEKAAEIVVTATETATEKSAPKVEVPAELENLKAFVSANPTHSDARYQLAAAYVKAQNFAAASENLETIVEKDATHVDAFIMLAYIAEQQKDFLKSKLYLEKVANLNPDYAGIHYKLGVLTNQNFKGQKKAASKHFKEAFNRDPNNADAHYQYAIIKLEHSGNYVKAIEHLMRTLDIQPLHQKANFDLAVAFYELGDKPNAAKFYTRACEVSPQYKTPTYEEIFKYDPPQKPVEVISEPQPAEPQKVKDNGITVLITGATSGIGKATAARFAQEGYRVILTGRRGDRLEELKKAFEDGFQNRVNTLQFDVRSLEEVKKAIENLDEEWKNIDILINNAGLALGLAPIHEGNIEHWDTMIDTNIKGLLYITRAVAPQMVARGKGHILNICSTAGKEVYPQGNVYAATKHAVDALTKAMRQDLYKHGVRVSQVAPGHVEETEFALVRFEGDAERAKIYEDFQPLRAADVADLIHFIVTRPEHVNIQDALVMSTQQAGFALLDRSGRKEKS